MGQSLDEFYRAFQPPITGKHHTCVGLSLDLAGRILSLEENFPGIKLALFAASCEEVIQHNLSRSSSTYLTISHLKIRISPGYHVAHPVVVMKDGLYPHTG